MIALAIAIDYFRKLPDPEETEKIFALVVIDETGITTSYSESQIGDVADFLAIRTRIITYGNTLRNLYPYLPPEFLDDWEVRKKAFDIFNYLKRETGHDISLSNITRATLGADTEILRLPKNFDLANISEINTKLESRVKYLQKIWEYGINNGKVYYYSRGELSSVEVNFNDNYDAD